MREFAKSKDDCLQTPDTERLLRLPGRVSAMTIALLLAACGGSTAPGDSGGPDILGKGGTPQAGSLDTSFGPTGSGLNSNVYAALDDDDDDADEEDGTGGKGSSDLLIGGVFTEYDGTTTSNIALLNDDVSLAKFKTKTGFNGGVKVIVQQGKSADLLDASKNSGYIVGGEFTTFDGKSAPYIVRLKGNGKLDKSFTPPTLNGSVWAVSVQPSGQILVGGVFTGGCGTTPNFLTRLNPDGTLDTAFNDNSCGINGYVKSFAQDGDQIVIGGGFINYPVPKGTPAQAWVTRINDDGTWDSTFEQSGKLDGDVQLGYVDFVLVQPADRKVIAGGFFTKYVSYAAPQSSVPAPFLIRFEDDGAVDSAFTTAGGTGLEYVAHGGALQSDGAILVAGEAKTFDGVASPYLVRLQSTGALDPTFKQTGSGLNNRAYSVLIQETDDDDETVIVMGAFTEYNGVSQPYIVRLFD
jgi:uncharacterized delta-60 repeat protein